MALITAARARQTQALKRVNSTLLDNLIDTASVMIENYCDTTFVLEAKTETYIGNGLTYLFTRAIPITVLSTVTITDASGTETELASTNFEYVAATGRLVFGPNNSSGFSRFPGSDFDNISIIYTAGYSVVPAPVQEACVQLVGNIYGKSNSAKVGLAQYRMGEYNEVRALDTAYTPMLMTGMVQSLLARYRRMVIL